MLTSKEQHIIEALIEAELNTAKESVIISDEPDPVVLEYIRTLTHIKNKLTRHLRIK